MKSSIMEFPVKGGRITASFTQPRPLDNPGQHIHGAIDIAGGDGLVRAPNNGILVAYVIIRTPHGAWLKNEKDEIKSISVRDYWADIFGGIISIEEPNGLFHIMAHFFAKALHAQYPLNHYLETARIGRWPEFIWHSEPVEVHCGQRLLPIGNAGFSTGPHVHWEIHHSKNLDSYADRIDPASYFERR